jgi:hypothetical protein
MLKQNFIPTERTMQQFIEFLEPLETLERLEKNKNKDDTNKRSKKSEDDKKGQKRKSENSKWCAIHESYGHNTKDCSTLARLRKERAAKEGSSDKSDSNKKARYNNYKKPEGKSGGSMKEKLAYLEKQTKQVLKQLSDLHAFEVEDNSRESKRSRNSGDDASSMSSHHSVNLGEAVKELRLSDREEDDDSYTSAKRVYEMFFDANQTDE